MEFTPEQFNKLVTRSEFERLEGKVDGLEEKMDVKFDAVMQSLDEVVSLLKTAQLENVSNQAAHDRMDDKIDSHEIRLKKLEMKSV